MSNIIKPSSPLSVDLSRRNALRLGLIALATGLVARSFLQPEAAHAAALAGSPLIVYFSRSGNTRTVAEQIHRRVGGDLFEVRTTHTYPEAYRATTEQARREQDTGFRPTLAASVADMETRSTLFLGYPNWWGTMPMALFTFLESYDFSGKTLVPFCTHGGSGLGRGPADMARLCPKATILTGLAVRGENAASAQNDVDKWLRNNKLV